MCVGLIHLNFANGDFAAPFIFTHFLIECHIAVCWVNGERSGWEAICLCLSSFGDGMETEGNVGIDGFGIEHFGVFGEDPSYEGEAKSD